MVISETAYAHDGVHVGGSDVSMGGIVTRQCTCGDHKDGRYASTVAIVIGVAVA